MPNFVSPGVYVIEKDISEYTATINSSVVGIVGFASRGPIAGVGSEKATLITSPQQLVDTFGEPSEDIKGQALEGALEILEGTNSLRFVRVAGDGNLTASAIAQFGSCPGALVSGTNGGPIAIQSTDIGMSAIGSQDLGTSDVKITVTVYDNTRAKVIDAKDYYIHKGTISLSSSEGATTIKALKKVFGGELDGHRVGAFANSSSVDASSYIVGLAAGSGATIELSAGIRNTESGAYWSALPIFNQLDVTGGISATPQSAGEAGDTGQQASASVTCSGTSINAADGGYLVKSLWPGAGYNAGTKVDGTTSGVSFEVNVNGGPATQNEINNNGVAAETFETTLTSGLAFLEEQIGVSYVKRTSNYLTGYVVSSTNWNSDYTDLTVTALTNFVKPFQELVGTGNFRGMTGDDNVAYRTDVSFNPRFVKLVQGTVNLASGDNGVPTTDTSTASVVVGEVRGDGGKTGIEALDDDVLNISLALAPGTGVGNLEAVQNGLITKAEATTNFLALLSPPYAVGRTSDAIDWSNGFGTLRNAAVNSSYAAIYWPWVKVFQVYDGKDRWLAPEIYAARQMGVTDNISEPWFAPAGFVRGRLTKPSDVEVVLNQGDRDSLYSGGNVINPIVNFPQRGIVIYGQRTSQRSSSALDRVNIRRMMIYIKKQILASCQRLVFEPNDRFTWTRVEQLINPMLDDIARKRGITEFRVVCDESVNTPVRVDRNEMWCKVLIKPTKTAEVVVFELNLTNQSAQLGNQ